MFQDEICRHPAVDTVAYSPHRYLETHWWLMAAVLLDEPGPLFATQKRYNGYGSKGNARDLMIDLLAKCVPDFDPPTDDRALVFDGWEALVRVNPEPVFFEKSPQILAQWAALSLMLEWIGRTDLTVKVIGLVRNPHGVMYSAAKLFGTDPQTRQLAWLNGCRNLLAIERMLPKDSYMRVRYEDLVASPVDGFAEIARFIEVAPDETMGEGTRSGSGEKWKNDPGYVLNLHPAVRQMAQSMDYADADLDNAHGKDNPSGSAFSDTSRRQRFRIWLNRRRDRLFRSIYFRLRAILQKEP